MVSHHGVFLNATISSSSIIEKFFGDYLTSRQTDRRMYINLNVIFVSLGFSLRTHARLDFS